MGLLLSGSRSKAAIFGLPRHSDAKMPQFPDVCLLREEEIICGNKN